MKSKAFVIIWFCISNTLFGQQPPALKIAYLTDNFYVFQTYRSYKGNPTSSNGLYVVTNEGVIMIDSPWDVSQCQPLLDSIEKKHHKKVILCIATHSHADRTGGLSYYRQKGIKTYTSKQTDSISQKSGENRAEYTFQKDTVFKVGQYSFQTCYAGAGHTRDNIFIWFNTNKVLYGGCAIKSYEADDLGYIGEADLKAWPFTLKKVKQKFPKAEFVIPGHQGWKSLQSIDHTLELLRSHK